MARDGENPAAKSIEPSGQWLFEFDRPPLQIFTPGEIYERIDYALLGKLSEDRRLELKSSAVQARAIGDYVGMWANTSPYGGIIVVGVRDNRTIDGCTNLSARQLNELELAGETYAPEARLSSKRIPVINSSGAKDFVLIFLVEYHRTRVVRTSSGAVFVRRGDHKVELTNPDAIRQLQAEKGEISYENEPSTLRYPRDFNARAITDFVATVREKKQWDAFHSEEDILVLQHLGKFEGKKFVPNIACSILFAMEPRLELPGCRIRFLRFEGNNEGVGTKWNAVKDEFIDGPMPAQIEQAAAVLKSQLRKFSRLGAGGKFFTSHEYPEFAWYEAIVNACAHRSYGNGAKNSPIFIKMFDDRLEVDSPGPFPPFVTQDNIYHMHMPRNPFLMDAMYFLKFVRCAHEGTRRMRAEMLGNELPEPEFRQDEIGHALVRVTLRNNIQHRRVWVDSDVAQLLGARLAHGLSEDEKRCINFCAEYGRINVSDAVRLINREWGTCKAILKKLEARGILEHVHRDDLERDPAAHFRLKGSPPA